MISAEDARTTRLTGRIGALRLGDGQARRPRSLEVRMMRTEISPGWNPKWWVESVLLAMHVIVRSGGCRHMGSKSA